MDKLEGVVYVVMEHSRSWGVFRYRSHAEEFIKEMIANAKQEGYSRPAMIVEAHIIQ
jgi:hypothetical protein